MLKYFQEFGNQLLPIFRSGDSHLWERHIPPDGRATLDQGRRFSASKKPAQSSTSESSSQALFLS